MNRPDTVIVEYDDVRMEVAVIRARKVKMNGVDVFECLVSVGGKLGYVYKSA